MVIYSFTILEMMYEERAAIIAMYNAGNRQCEIAKTLKISPNKVYRAIKRYKELNTLMDRPRSGRPVTANTPRNRSIIRKRIARNPNRPIRKMAKDLQIGEISVRRLVKNQLEYHPYKPQKVQYLNERMKEIRLQRAKELKKRGAAACHKRVLFSDEKFFTI